MRTLSVLLVVALALLQAAGEESKSKNQPAAGAPTAGAKPLPFVKQIRKTVAFITVQCQDGTDPHKVVTGHATGFFVAYPDKRLGPNRQFTYLVTNRHVAECWNEQNKPQHILSFGLQLNLKDGSSTELQTPGNAPWILPSDDSVDLALLPVSFDPTKVDVLTVPVSEFVTADVVTAQGIDEGARLLVTGYFYQLQGLRTMEPIIREGAIAMMPEEQLPTTTGRPGKLYLGEVHIFGGNSGSPVFVDLAGLRDGSLRIGFDYRMLGVVSGYYYEDAEFNLQIAATLKGETRANSGIAMIVPATALKDLLEDSRVQAMRDEEAARWKHQQSINCGPRVGCSESNLSTSIRSREYNNVSVEPVLRYSVNLSDSLKVDDSVKVADNP